MASTTTFRDVNSLEHFPLSYLDALGRPLPQYFGTVRYHSWGPQPQPQAPAPAAVVPNALEKIPKDAVLGLYAKTDSRIASGLHRIREALQRLAYPSGFSRNDGISVERALELRFRQLYKTDYAEEEDPFVWQVYTWTTAEILNRLVYLKLQVDDLFGTPVVKTTGVPKSNAIGDPDYYSGVDRVTPNLVRPINTRDTWTQASVGEYDPLHNYGIRRLVAEGKGCVGYRYSCCYQSMGSEGCIIGYPERERGSIPQLYTWFGGFPPSEITKQYRGLVFQGNEVKCKHLHAKIMERITTTMLGKIVAGNFDGLTDNERKSVYRIAELMHEYNENIAPGSPPNLPKSTAQKDITEYLRRVVRLEKTTTEVAKEKELAQKQQKLEDYLKSAFVDQLFYNPKVLPTRLREYPFNESGIEKLTQLLQKIYENYEILEKIFEKSIDKIVYEVSVKASSNALLDWVLDIDNLEKTWAEIISGVNIRWEQRKNVYIELLKQDPFQNLEYEKMVQQRIPSGAPAREYLLELGRLRLDVPFDQLALEADKSKNLDKIEKKDVEALRKKRKGIEFKELQRVTNDFLSAITSWQLGGDKQLKENVMTMFEQMFQHIELSNNEEWIKFIRKNRSHVLRWISSVASAPSIAKAKTF